MEAVSNDIQARLERRRREAAELWSLDAADRGRAERMHDFGGIRIEDNVLVTSGQPDVLTADVA